MKKLLLGLTLLTIASSSFACPGKSLNKSIYSCESKFLEGPDKGREFGQFKQKFTVSEHVKAGVEGKVVLYTMNQFDPTGASSFLTAEIRYVISDGIDMSNVSGGGSNGSYGVSTCTNSGFFIEENENEENGDFDHMKNEYSFADDLSSYTFTGTGKFQYTEDGIVENGTILEVMTCVRD